MYIFPKIALFSVSLLWGVSFVFTKGYLDVLNPLVFTAYSFLASGALFSVLILVSGRKFTFRVKEGVMLGVLLFFLEAPQMIGLSQTTAANTAFITSLGILLIPLLNRLLYKRRITASTWTALAVALIGIHLLTGGIHNFNQGDLWVIVAALGCLFYMVFSDTFEKEKESNILDLCAQQFLTVGALSLLIAVISNKPLGLQVENGSWVPLAVLTILFTLVPYFLIQWAERYATEVEETFYSILEPLIGGVAAWTIGAETATPIMIFGGGLIIVALIISEHQRLQSRIARRRTHS